MENQPHHPSSILGVESLSAALCEVFIKNLPLHKMHWAPHRAWRCLGMLRAEAVPQAWKIPTVLELCLLHGQLWWEEMPWGQLLHRASGLHLPQPSPWQPQNFTLLLPLPDAWRGQSQPLVWPWRWSTALQLLVAKFINVLFCFSLWIVNKANVIYFPRVVVFLTSDLLLILDLGRMFHFKRWIWGVNDGNAATKLVPSCQVATKGQSFYVFFLNFLKQNKWKNTVIWTCWLVSNCIKCKYLKFRVVNRAIAHSKETMECLTCYFIQISKSHYSTLP